MPSDTASSALPSGKEPPRRPEDVAARVDLADLRAVLQHGRPPARVGTVDETVLCVHGLGHDSWDFAPLAVQCPRDLSLRTFDLPGFGPARIDDAAPTAVVLADLVNAIAAEARALPRPPVVVASSLGGHAALLAALEHPGVFAGMVLLSPGGLVEVPQAMQAVLRGYYSADAIMGRPDDEIIRNSRRIFANPHPLGEALAVRKLSLHRADRAIKERFAVPFASVCDDVFKRPVLGEVHHLKGLPLSVIFGSGDVVVPLSSGRALESRADARLHILDRCGHCAHLEDIDRTATLVFAFAHETFARAAIAQPLGGPHVPR
jgi:pimeloyl-ACP methyl ester carboxylesterase